MISPENFISHLKGQGFRFFTGVPCSYFRHVINRLQDHPGASYYIAPNEGSALALASGAHLAGEEACVMIQNSGLGNLINPLTSLNMIYEIPVLLFVSGRAWGLNDEPQHEVMGKRMHALLDSLNIPHWDFPQEEEKFRECLDQAVRVLRAVKRPVVLFVRKGTFAPYEVPEKSGTPPAYPMKRIDAISILKGCFREQDAVFATTGKPSRELFTVGDRPGNFYMQGSMGHIGSLALGTAIAQPQRRVIVIDGDGALLTHLGAMSMIGHYRPRNFYHLLLDNEAYETTGDQDTTARSTDFAKVAAACGYLKTYEIREPRELQSRLPQILEENGPVFVRIKINRLPTEDIPRITTKYQAPEITDSFKRHLQPKKAAKIL